MNSLPDTSRRLRIKVEERTLKTRYMRYKEIIKSMLFKRPPAAVALCASLLFGLATHAPAQKAARYFANSSGVSPSVRQAIQTVYDAQGMAFSHKNIAGYLAHRTPNYVYISADGQNGSVENMRKAFEKIFQYAGTSSATTSILNIASKSGVVVVTARQLVQLNIVRPQDQKVAHMVSDLRVRDFWVQTSDGWQEKKSKELSARMTVNGQPAH